MKWSPVSILYPCIPCKNSTATRKDLNYLSHHRNLRLLVLPTHPPYRLSRSPPLYIPSVILLPLIGRAWLYIALNEQAMESYIRMFIENQEVAQEFYLR